jgi:predicted nucleic acid-binding protein
VTRLILDTNVLVSFLTERNPEQQRLANGLFEEAANGEIRLLLPQAALFEMVYVLRNLHGVEDEEIAALCADLFALPGVMTVDALPWARLLRIWPSEIREYGDACLAAVVMAGYGDAVVTFDEKFHRRLRRRGIAYHWEQA